MHWEKASSCEPAEPDALGEPAEPVDDELLHADGSRTKAVLTMMAAATRAAGGHDRRDRRITRRLLFIMAAVLYPGR
jgi:hypothetical protein